MPMPENQGVLPGGNKRNGQMPSPVGILLISVLYRLLGSIQLVGMYIPRNKLVYFSEWLG
jgi:hypothetical protein